MIEGNYYIVNTDDTHYTAILAISTNFLDEKPRSSLDETKAVVRIRNKIKVPPFMDEYTPIPHNDCFLLMQTAEWQ